MSEIPDDIMQLADKVAAGFLKPGIGCDVLAGSIARLILAERIAARNAALEEAAKVVEHKYKDVNVEDGGYVTCYEITYDIRALSKAGSD